MSYLIILGSFLILSSVIFWLYNDPGYVVRDGKSFIDFPGKIRLVLLRMLVPWVSGVSKSLGIIKYQMTSIDKIKVPTSWGDSIIWVYRPLYTSDQALPVYFNFHGGGFVVGYPEQDDLLCRYMAFNARCIVVNMNYVLAPEHPYPAPLEQSWQTIQWVLLHARKLNIDPENAAIGGQSAGASISAGICLLAKENGSPLFRLQVLNYGYFDTDESAWAKYISKKSRQALSPGMLAFFQNLYLPDFSSFDFLKGLKFIRV